MFDVVYLDPPYHEVIDEKPMAQHFLDRVTASGILSGQARVVVQHDRRVMLSDTAGDLEVVRQKKYSDSLVTMYARPGTK